MLHKAKEDLLSCINVIGVSEIIRYYTFLAIFIVIDMLIFMDFSIFTVSGLIYLLISLALYPFSIALYDLVIDYVFNDIELFRKGIVGFIWWLLRVWLLYLVAPLFGTIFIILIVFTDNAEKIVNRYKLSKASEK